MQPIDKIFMYIRDMPVPEIRRYLKNSLLKEVFTNPLIRVDSCARALEKKGEMDIRGTLGRPPFDSCTFTWTAPTGEGEILTWLVPLILIQSENKNTVVFEPCFYRHNDENMTIDQSVYFPAKMGVLGLDSEYKFMAQSFGILGPGMIEDKDDIKDKELHALLYYAAQIIGFSLSLMNLKNIDLYENIVPEKVVKKRFKSGKHAYTKYYTLKIVTAHYNKGSVTSSRESQDLTAMHLMRGHFKDYSKGKGLFGKLKGMYWWTPTIRGSEKAGVVIKDYEVSTE